MTSREEYGTACNSGAYLNNTILHRCLLSGVPKVYKLLHKKLSFQLPMRLFNRGGTQRVIVCESRGKGLKSARVKRHVGSVFWAAGDVLAFPRAIFSSPFSGRRNPSKQLPGETVSERGLCGFIKPLLRRVSSPTKWRRKDRPGKSEHLASRPEHTHNVPFYARAPVLAS